MTLEYYKNQHPETILLRTTTGAVNPREFLRNLCQTLGIICNQWNKHMYQRVIEKLKGSGRMIIVDEAHKLLGNGKPNFSIFELLRDIHDMTACPLVLVGTSKIVNAIEENLRETKEWISDQFKSRVCLIVDLMTALGGGSGPGGGGGQPFDSQDIAKIFKNERLKLHPKAARWCASLASEPGRGGLRTIKNILMMCQVLFADQDQVDIDMVKAAFANIWNRPNGPNVVAEEEPAEDRKVASAG
jgi:hypothetical protein